MDNAKALKAILAVKGESTLTVGGVSMMPVLRHGQTVSIHRPKHYAVGDIFVYEYKNEGLLAHRLLKIENGRYFCIIGNEQIDREVGHFQQTIVAEFIVCQGTLEVPADKEADQEAAQRKHELGSDKVEQIEEAQTEESGLPDSQ